MPAQEQLDIVVRLKDFATKELGTLKGVVHGVAGSIEKAFHGVHKVLNSVEGVLALGGIGLGLHEIFEEFKETAEHAHNLELLSKQIGVSTDALSAFELAAQKTGTGLDELQVAFRNLNKAVGEFQLTGEGKLAGIIEVLGPGFRQLVETGAPVEDLFVQLSREMRNLDKAQQVFLASKLFGKGGARTLLVLGEDLDEAAAKAKKFGTVISEESLESATEFHSAIVDMQAALQGLRNQVILPLLPIITKFVKSLTDELVSGKPRIIEFFADLTDATAVLAGGLQKVITFVANFKQIGLAEEVKGAASSLVQLRKDQEEDAKFLKFLKDLPGDAVENRRIYQSSIEIVYAHAKALAHAQVEYDEAREAFEKYKETAADTHLQEVLEAAAKKLHDLASGHEDAGHAADEHAEAEHRVTSALDEQIQAVKEHRNALEGIKAGFRDLQKESKLWGDAAREATKSVASALAHDVSGALLDIVDGTKSAKEAFRDMARAILKDIARIIIETIILKAVQGGLGGLFGGGGGGTSSIDTGGGLEDFARGGIVGGHLQSAPGLARGGVVTHESLFRLREAGRNEAVVPLPDNRSIPVRLQGGRGGWGATNVYNFSFAYSFATPAQMKAELERHGRTIAQIVVDQNNRSMAVREGLN